MRSTIRPASVALFAVLASPCLLLSVIASSQPTDPGVRRVTSTEFSLLEVLLRQVGHPVSKGELSERALGRPHAPRDRSVDVHLSSIRQKLGTHWDGRPLIQTIHRRGYLLVKE